MLAGLSGNAVHLHPSLCLLVPDCISFAGGCLWPYYKHGKALVTCLPHAGMSEGFSSVDAVVAISLARLKGLYAQHRGSLQDACVRFEEGITAGAEALATEDQAGLQWLLHHLVADLRLTLADTYGCMVRPTL